MSTSATPAPHTSFFHKIGDFFKDLFDNKAAWEQTASTTLAVVGPLLATIVTLAAGPAAGTAVGNVIGQGQKDLAAASALLGSDSGGTAKQQVLSLIQGLQANLQTLLQDADVKNDANAAKITDAITLIDGELAAIVNAA